MWDVCDVCVVLTFESVDEILKCRTIQMKATEQYFPVVRFIILARWSYVSSLWMKS